MWDFVLSPVIFVHPFSPSLTDRVYFWTLRFLSFWEVKVVFQYRFNLELSYNERDWVFFYKCKGYFYISSPNFLLDYWSFSQFLGTLYKTEIWALYNRSWSTCLITLLNIFLLHKFFFNLCSQIYQFLMLWLLSHGLKGFSHSKVIKNFSLVIFSDLYHFIFYI